MRACGPGEFLVLALFLFMFLVLVLVLVSGSGSASASASGFGFLASFEAQLTLMARRLSHRVVAIGYTTSRQRQLVSHPQYYKFSRAPALGGEPPP